MKSKTIYLASPYGFSAQWNNQADFNRKGWVYRVAQANLSDAAEAGLSSPSSTARRPTKGSWLSSALLSRCRSQPFSSVTIGVAASIRNDTRST